MFYFNVQLVYALKISMREAGTFPVSFGNRFKSKRSSTVESHEAFLKLTSSMSALLLHSYIARNASTVTRQEGLRRNRKVSKWVYKAFEFSQRKGKLQFK